MSDELRKRRSSSSRIRRRTLNDKLRMNVQGLRGALIQSSSVCGSSVEVTGGWQTPLEG